VQHGLAHLLEHQVAVLIDQLAQLFNPGVEPRVVTKALLTPAYRLLQEHPLAFGTANAWRKWREIPCRAVHGGID
jgi:hypothetical protein